MYNNPTLTIYKASAGSGKTFKLTTYYVAKVLEKPAWYKNILAITFTNKATNEMKIRILEVLYELSIGNKNDYFDAVLEIANVNEYDIQNKAQTALSYILHDFSSFSVSTIDAFFQKIIRSFAKEFKLQGGFEVNLDTEMVLNHAIDKLLSDLGKTNKKLLTRWMVSYLKYQVENDSKWNLKNELNKLSNQLFNENFKNLQSTIWEKLQDKEFLLEYINNLNKKIKTLKQEQCNLGKKGLECIAKYNLTKQDFNRGSIYVFFEKIAQDNLKNISDTIQNSVDNISKWYTKKTPVEIKQRIENAFDNELNQLLKTVIDLYDKSYYLINSLEIINYYFYNFGVLVELAEYIKEYQKKSNSYLIAEQMDFLQQITQDNPVPFIYEKAGKQFNFFMLDEFQDTSVTQWQNLKPLLEESISKQYNNLIVGDIKQSIYRWRNGDWRLLHNKAQADLHNAIVKSEPLQDNWRSKPNIIDFNNNFFKATAQLIQSQINNEIDNIKNDSIKKELQSRYQSLITDIYADVAQQAKKKGEGYIYISENNDKDTIANDIIKQIERLQDNGYKASDIGILVRGQKDCRLITERLLMHDLSNNNAAYNFKVISEEALFVSQGYVTQTIIFALKYLLDATNKITIYSLASAYYKVHKKNHTEIFLCNNPEEILPKQFLNDFYNYFSLSLWDLTEEIIRIFELNTIKIEYAYLEGFLNLLQNYLKNNDSDIACFINWWDESGYKTKINLSKSVDAIEVLTIHKSKGLAFEAVLLPFLSWGILPPNSVDTTLWAKLDDKTKPFNSIPFVPIKFQKKLSESYFSVNYYEEYFLDYIDNLNLLYVAFTRAKDALYLFIENSKSKFETIDKLIKKVFESNNSLTEHFNNIDENALEKGNLQQKTISKPAVEKSNIVLKNNFPVIKWQNRIQIKRYSENYFADNTQKNNNVNYGILMHEILSKLIYSSDLSKIIDAYKIEGKISNTEAKIIENKLQNILQLHDVLDWFTDKYKILTEQTILLAKGKTCIPDRIMIDNSKNIILVDYKFADAIPEHSKQIKFYKNTLLNMGYKKVKMYLLYGNTEEVIEIK